jgi:hypothetical protein
MASLTVAVITHDRLKKLEHLLYELKEQTQQPDKVVVYCSGYEDDVVDYLRGKYKHFTFSVQPNRKDWGHEKRAIAFQECETDYITTINDDDQYPFVFLEMMMKEAKLSKAGIVYCDFATRTQPQFWIDAKLERGSITNGCMLITNQVAKTVPYKHRTYAGDWYFVEDCINAGVTFSKVPHTLAFCY